jgi:hypothetical protein
MVGFVETCDCAAPAKTVSKESTVIFNLFIAIVFMIINFFEGRGNTLRKPYGLTHIFKMILRIKA